MIFKVYFSKKDIQKICKALDEVDKKVMLQAQKFPRELAFGFANSFRNAIMYTKYNNLTKYSPRYKRWKERNAQHISQDFWMAWRVLVQHITFWPAQNSKYMWLAGVPAGIQGKKFKAGKVVFKEGSYAGFYGNAVEFGWGMPERPVMTPEFKYFCGLVPKKAVEPINDIKSVWKD